MKKGAVLAALALACQVATPHGDEPSTLGFDEKPGALVPLDLSFRSEDGSPVTLRDLVSAPTIFMFVYYHCENACGLLPPNLAEALAQMKGQPGKDYRVITLSIDDRETPAAARDKRAFVRPMLPADFPPDAWRFLTGQAEAIDTLTDAVGFHFVRKGEDFDHPLGLVIVSPKGKVVRYMRGSDFLAADLKLSLLEASQERVSVAVSRLLRFCLAYDPKNNRLAFDFLKVGGSVTLACAAALILFLVARGRRRRAKEGSR